MQKNVQYKRICKEDTYMFNYTQLPDDLFKIDLFSKLSLHAKVLYSFMLRRVSMSKANNQIDNNGDVYIYYGVARIMEDFNCSQKTAYKIMSELEEIGLIERKRQGQGKADIIYVNKFSEVSEAKYDEEEPELPIEHMEHLYENDENADAENIRGSAENSDEKKILFKNGKNYQSEKVKITNQEAQNLRRSYKENNYKEIINSSSISPPLISREHVRLMEEEEEERYKRHIHYQEAERLYSAQIAAAVYAELIKRDKDYLESFNADMFSRICKSVSQSREPVVSMPGLVNWCLDRVGFTPTDFIPGARKSMQNKSTNQFCQFPQRNYDYAELERQLLLRE